MLVYSLDFWEHSIGIATMLWAIVYICDVVHHSAGWRGAAAAGALLGLAATMRIEAIVYTGLLALGALWLLARARVPGRTMGQLAVAGGGGLAIVLLANQALEQLTLGGSLRAARTAGTATAGASDVGRRVDEAATTLVGMNRFETPLDWIVGVLVALGVGYGVFRLFSSDADRRRFGVVVIGAAGLVYAVRFGAGLGFVPGLL